MSRRNTSQQSPILMFSFSQTRRSSPGDDMLRALFLRDISMGAFFFFIVVMSSRRACIPSRFPSIHVGAGRCVSFLPFFKFVDQSHSLVLRRHFSKFYHFDHPKTLAAPPHASHNHPSLISHICLPLSRVEQSTNLTTGHTTTTGMLPVLANATVTGGHMATGLSVLMESGGHLCVCCP